MNATKLPLVFAALLFAAGPALADDKVLTNAAIKKRLRSQRVSVNFNDTPAAEVIAFLRDITGLPVLIDPRSRLETASVSCALNNKPLGKVLDVITRQIGLDTKISCGVLVFGLPKDLKSYPKKPAKLKAGPKDAAALKLAERRLSMNFDKTSFADATTFLKDIVGVELYSGDDFKPIGPVQLWARNLTVFQTLTVVAHSQGGRLALEDGSFIFLGPKKKN